MLYCREGNHCINHVSQMIHLMAQCLGCNTLHLSVGRLNLNTGYQQTNPLKKQNIAVITKTVLIETYQKYKTKNSIRVY